MQRDAYADLLNWKSSPRRKPLILKGARQVGKTWLLKHFGEQEFDAYVYFNFEEEPQLKEFFKEEKVPERILRNLALYRNTRIDPNRTLLIFDEIQESNNALNSLKYFSENAPEYHIAAAGSLIGIKLSKEASFPVGKVDFLDLKPMTFLEFLDALGQSELTDLIRTTTSFEAYPQPLHTRLIEYLRIYYYVGGMPEPVHIYRDSMDVDAVRKAQRGIITGYAMDFSKHAPGTDIPKIRMIWESLPAQLGKENKKFLYSVLRTGSRAREYENALLWLEETGLILRSSRVSAGKSPLKAHAKRNIFKIYALDVGLLGALSNVAPTLLVQGKAIFQQFEGMFVENYVAQQLAARADQELYYWESSGSAEVDFIYEHSGNIFPLEAKAGVNLRSRSLAAYGTKYHPPILSRTTLLNLRRDHGKVNYPLYAISLFPKLALL